MKLSNKTIDKLREYVIVSAIAGENPVQDYYKLESYLDDPEWQESEYYYDFLTVHPEYESYTAQEIYDNIEWDTNRLTQLFKTILREVTI